MSAASTAHAVQGDRVSGARCPALAIGVFVALVAVKFLIHALLSNRYGYFRDELYYLDMARHLAPGYVDAAPLVAVYAKLALLMGGQLPALRILAAVAGASVVALTILITRWIGGGRYAQFLAGLCALLSPAILAMDNFLSMNAFEPLFWMGCVAVLIRIIQTGNSRLWIWFGVLAGLGLENKHSTVFFGFAFLVALLVTQYRSELGKRWIWLGGMMALVIALPNLIWQIMHHFPTLEDLENVQRTGKNVTFGPLGFLWQQVFVVHPVIFALCIMGLVWLFRRRDLRILAWTYIAFYVVMFVFHAKHYYLFPIYPMLLAAGAVQMEQIATRRRWLRVATAAVVILATLPFDLFLLPIFSPPKYVRYSGFLHLEQTKSETHHESVWPQLFADQMGWNELVKQVAGVYWSLPAEERATTGIFAGNYGEAGAINLFGPGYGLPRAICAHQNHFFWGPPMPEPQTYIVLQANPAKLRRQFGSVEAAATHSDPYGMGEENGPIWLCRDPRFALGKIWPGLKHWN